MPLFGWVTVSILLSSLHQTGCIYAVTPILLLGNENWMTPFLGLHFLCYAIIDEVKEKITYFEKR